MTDIWRSLWQKVLVQLLLSFFWYSTTMPLHRYYLWKWHVNIFFTLYLLFFLSAITTAVWWWQAYCVHKLIDSDNTTPLISLSCWSCENGFLYCIYCITSCVKKFGMYREFGCRGHITWHYTSVWFGKREREIESRKEIGSGRWVVVVGTRLIWHWKANSINMGNN